MDLVKENLGADLNNGREKSEDTQNTLEAEITLPEVEVKEKLEGILKPAIIESKQVQAVEEPASKRGWRRRKKDKNSPEERKLVAPWKLYRFAKCSDVLMMFVAVLGAVVTGSALPFHMLMFGQVISRFVYFSIAVQSIEQGKKFNISVSSIDDLMKTVALTRTNKTYYYCSNSDTLNTNLLNQYLNSTDIKAELGDIVSVFSYYYVALATASMIGAFAANLTSNISAYRQTRRIRIAFYNSVLRQEVGWFDTTKTGQLNTRLQDDTEKIQSGIGDKVAVFLQYTTTFVAGYVIAFTKSWKLSLVLATMVPMLVLMAAAIAKVIASFTFREQKAYASAGAVAEEVLSAIRTVVAFGGEEKEAERYNVVLKKARAEGLKKGLSVSIVTGGIFFILYCMYALGFWYGAVLITECDLAPGDVVTVFFSIMIGSFSLGSALPEIQTFSSAIGSAGAVFDIIDRVSAIDPASEQGERPDTMTGDIEFTDVVFNYPARPDVQILHGLDLKIKVGQTVALVGPSGCGKSTTVQLIQRFYDPSGGQVTVDGKNIKDLNLRWLREHIGVVSQEPILFNTTIAENIRYGKLDVTMEEIEQAARKANAYNFISELPEAFDTHVGERGTQLSGGQKQRIAIARALVRNPKILLLDEATSALDNKSEKVVQEALDKAREGRTTIIVAHRLSTIQNANVIVSIQDGRVVEMGTHSELMDKEGLYFELVTAQTIEKEKKESKKTRKASEKEPLAEFKAAVVRSASVRKQQSNSLRKRNSPSASSQAHNPSSESGLAFERQTSHHSQFERQTSHHSQFERQTSHHSQTAEDLLTPGIADYFSLEDLPVIAHPSPNPGRRAISVGPDDEIPDKVTNEAVQEVTIKFDVEEDEEGEKVRRASIKGLLKKDTEEPVLPVTFRELLSLNAPDWPFVVVGVLFSFVQGTFFPVISVLFSNILRIYGYIDKDKIVKETSYYSLGFVGLAFLAFGVNFVASFSLSVAGERLTKRLRLKSFQSMLRQEISWFDERAHATGALTTRLAVDASEVKGATGIRLGTIFQLVAGFTSALIIAFVASWQLTLVLMLAFPMIAAVSFLQLRLIRGRTVKNKKLLEGSGRTAVESFENLRTVVGLGLGDKFCQIYSDQLAEPFRANLRSVLVQSVIIGIAQGTIFYLYAIGFRFGAFLVAYVKVSYNDIFQVYGAVVFTALSLGRATSFAPDASKGQLSAGRIMALLKRPSAVDASRPDGRKLDHPTGHVSLDSVFFTYITRPDVPILGGLSLDVKPGKTLALVGPSGCGKSTVVSLVERFYDPTNGSVQIEGEDIREFNIKWLRQQIGIVSQEPTLFDASVADNIRYGANFREVSEEEVTTAAKAANIHSFIETLPMGYNTNVGAKGTQLSGGQKQRIAIARALVRNPKILLLDEATSALDTESEKVVQEALDKAREGRTSIVIAHRLSTIYNSDCIAVIHKGQVLEQGTHAELMARKGAYYHLNTVTVDDEDDGGNSDDNAC